MIMTWSLKDNLTFQRVFIILLKSPNILIFSSILSTFLFGDTQVSSWVCQLYLGKYLSKSLAESDHENKLKIPINSLLIMMILSN